MPELTDAQKVNREVTQKRIAVALEALAGTGGRGLPAGGTDGDVLVKNGATDYAATWEKTPPQMGSLAHINTGNTADKAYQPGEYLVYNGQLYKVGSTAISQGQTLTPGGNIAATTVMGAPTTFEFQTIGFVNARWSSSERLLSIPIPLGYTNSTVRLNDANGHYYCRDFGQSTALIFNVTSIESEVVGPTLKIKLIGTGFENKYDVISANNTLTITLS